MHAPSASDVLPRLLLFAGSAFLSWILFLVALPGSGLLRAVSASLAAGLGANWICARVFGAGQWRDFGLAWTGQAARRAAWGLGLGLGAVAVLAGGAVATGAARLEAGAEWRPWPGLAAVLLAGAAGEELLFRGYGFQAVAAARPFWAIGGSGVLFGLTHWALNEHIGPLAAFNTALWGALLGFACWRTGALWLPIGLHFGWNLGLALLGQPLSGITMEAAVFRLVWTASEWSSGGPYGPEGGWPAALLAVVVYSWLRRIR
jgi:membrane protease YdiL (CAAX protease family)